MPTISPRVHRVRPTALLAVGLAGALLLTACTPAQEGGPASSVSPTATAAPATSIDLPDLGPSPAPDVLPDDEVERLRLAKQDSDWTPVAFVYPDAVRPAVEFERYTADDSYIDTLEACYVASGLKLGIKVNEIGETELSDAEVTSESDAIANFVCRSTVVMKPAPWNAAQIGYHYDYLTEFLAPCYAANGIENPAPPSRETYIAKWPNPGWAPGLGELFGTPEAAPIAAACPWPYA